MLHAQTNESVIVGWDDDSSTSASAWFIKEISYTPTAIKGMDLEHSSVVYDLPGRHVKNPRKGIYIINGTKVIVK